MLVEFKAGAGNLFCWRCNQQNLFVKLEWCRADVMMDGNAAICAEELALNAAVFPRII